MQIKALHPNFIMPTKGSATAGGIDIYMPEKGGVREYKTNKVHLGFSAAIPEGWIALLLPRSGVGSRGLQLVNTCGVIDADYRGEWIANLTVKPGYEPIGWEAGDRLLQAVLVPHYTGALTKVDELPSTSRGSGGFGSSGQ